MLKTKSGFKLKREALDWIKSFNQDEPINNITFKELYDAWSVPHYQKVSNDTSNGYKAAYRNCEALWYRQFTKIKAADLQKVVDDAKALDGKQLSRRSKLDIKYLLSILYKYAMQNDYCYKDYSKFITSEKRKRAKEMLSRRKKLKSCGKITTAEMISQGHILNMMYTGTRYGEYSRVAKDMIDLEARTITGIKTEAGRERIIPIAQCIFLL